MPVQAGYDPCFQQATITLPANLDSSGCRRKRGPAQHRNGDRRGDLLLSCMAFAALKSYFSPEHTSMYLSEKGERLINKYPDVIDSFFRIAEGR